MLYFSGQIALNLHPAISQGCHLKEKKQIFNMNIIGLRIPTGGRHTVFTCVAEQLN